MDVPETEPGLQRIMDSNVAALRGYEIGRYPGHLTLFKSRNHGLGRYYGWSEIAQAGVTTYEIPGSHVGLLQMPGVQELADRLDAAIRMAVVRPTSPQ